MESLQPVKDKALEVLMHSMQTMAEVLQRHFTADGIFQTPVPRLSVARSSSPTEPVQVVHQPALCIVIQGAKKVMLGDDIFEYDAARYLLVSVDIPLAGQVTQATLHKPYLCLRLDLDLTLLSDLLLQIPETGRSDTLFNGLAVSEMTAELREATGRLLALMDTPQDIEVLAPLIEREIMYWLARGEQGSLLRQLVNSDSRMGQVSKAIQHIQNTYRAPFDKQALLDIACMSATTFFQHFKAVTRMTPLQYQKQLRLQEARRLLLLSESDVTRIGYDVGYDSPSQFTREYSRQFGLPPSKDSQKLRSQGQAERPWF